MSDQTGGRPPLGDGGAESGAARASEWLRNHTAEVTSAGGVVAVVAMQVMLSGGVELGAAAAAAAVLGAGTMGIGTLAVLAGAIIADAIHER